MPWRKIALAVAVAAMLLVAYQLGAFDAFGDPARLKAALLALGPLGFLAFLLAYGFLQPFGIPGVIFVVAASLVWPPPIAIALSLAGATLSSMNGFAFSRYIARDWVEKRIPARLRKYDERLATRGFVTVFVLRLIFLTSPPLHALFGLSRVRFSTHLAASFLAYVVPIVAITILGDAALGVLKNQPLERWLAAAAVVVVAVVVRWAVRACSKRAASRLRTP